MYLLKTQQEYAYAIITGLVDYGINYFCISPGSRNADLTQAVLHLQKQLANSNNSNSPNSSSFISFESVVHFDERGAGFHALGVAKSKPKNKTTLPALICTSGTALANFYPAIIEAKQSNQPLLILSADRLPEQIEAGENQTIRQNNIYGEFVDWQYSFASFKTTLTIDYVYSVLRYAVSQLLKSNSIVHLNLPLAKPIFKPYNDKSAFFNEIKKQSLFFLNSQTNNLAHQYEHSADEYYLTDTFLPKELFPKLQKCKSILVLVGEVNANLQEISYLEKICSLFNSLKIPVFCDISSSLRKYNHLYFYKMYELYVDQLDRNFDLILHFGDALVGNKINQFLSNIQAKDYYHFSFNHRRFDPHQKISATFTLHSFKFFYQKLKSLLKKNYNQDKIRNKFLNTLTLLEKTRREQVISYQTKAFSEIDFVRDLLNFTFQNKKQNTALFLGNSMPIRYFDQLAHSLSFQRIFTNRGASGIDGLIATASGIASQIKDKLWLVIGDLSFLHDLNSLSLLQKFPIGIFVLNNQGGAIFKVLKMQKSFKKEIDQQICRHDYHFSNIAKDFCLPYWQITNKKELKNLFSDQKLERKESFIIEIVVNERDNIKQYNDFLESLKK